MGAESFDPGHTMLDIPWLGAATLARSVRMGMPRQADTCPSCRRPLSARHRYCSYCGESLARTLS